MMIIDLLYMFEIVGRIPSLSKGENSAFDKSDINN